MRDATSLVGNFADEESYAFNEQCGMAILVPISVRKGIYNHFADDTPSKILQTQSNRICQHQSVKASCNLYIVYEVC
jgi:hypothetical protein